MINSIHSVGVSNAWTPMTPTTPLLWLKADAGVSLSGANVVSWTDQSGNGWVFAARNTINRPSFSSTAWNSKKPGIQFGLAGAYTELVNQSAGLADLGAGFGVQIYMTFNAGTSTTTQKIISWISLGGANAAYEIETDNNLDEVAYSSGGVLYNGNTMTGSNMSTCHRLTVQTDSDGYTYSWINAAPSIIKQNRGTASATDTLVLGANALIGGFQLTGTLVELVIYNTFSLGHLVDVIPQYNSYARTKWGGLP